MPYLLKIRGLLHQLVSFKLQVSLLIVKHPFTSKTFYVAQNNFLLNPSKLSMVCRLIILSCPRITYGEMLFSLLLSCDRLHRLFYLS